MTSLHISDFDFDLPPELIARSPAEPRDASRMLVIGAAGALRDSQFRNLPEFLKPGDVLVLNDTRVIRARTQARLERHNGTSRSIEVFFASPLPSDLSKDLWQVLCKPGRRIRPGDRAIFGDGEFSGTFRDSLGADLHILELKDAEHLLDRFGQIPLPPYMDRQPTEADDTSYQTVFAAHPGAVAAPTAGLHFTPGMLQALRERGVQIATITLHVGIGTFLPLRTEHPEEHVLHPERYEVSEETAALLREALAENRRVISVGTTTTRTLEFLMSRYGEIRPGSGETNLYILPGFDFRIVSALLTNFHLPKSTLLMLVSAFAGTGNVLAAYRHAVAQGYRFYSYGDSTLLFR